MSTAVLEEPKAQKAIWRMPPVTIGMQVFWYEYAKRDRKPQRAVVESVAGDAIACRLMTGGLADYKSCARHMDDPFIRETNYQCAADVDQGGWDYTPEYKVEMAWRKDIEARLDAIEAATGIERMELRGPALYEDNATEDDVETPKRRRTKQDSN